MFDALNKYKIHDHFFLTATGSLEEVCNAPDDKDGVYIIYELKNGHVTMIYVGTSEAHSIGYSKDSLFGLKQAILKGVPVENEPRSQSWPVKMLSENIDALDIYWYVTYKGNLRDHPIDLQSRLLISYMRIYGEVPPWNKHVKSRKKPR